MNQKVRASVKFENEKGGIKVYKERGHDVTEVKVRKNGLKK